MKHLLLTSLLSLSSFCIIAQESDPVLMRINGKEIQKSEFEYIYHKNNSQQTTEKTLEEYMDLFKNFKLKVTEACAQGLDTTQAFINELGGYRKQLAQPYMVDRQVDEKLAQEAYNRLKENVEVSHILIRVEPDATPADTLKAYQKAMTIRNRIEKGESFFKLAKEFSEDASAKQNSGKLGYISGFMTVYPFETAAYNTPVGKISNPTRSQFGYHLVYVTNRRPDQGELLTAHIMRMVAQDATAEENEKAKKEINEIYQQVIQGGDFAALAAEKSTDSYSSNKGGEINWFGTGRMVKEYEDAAFALKEKGDISAPIRTPYGWHIIKLIDKRGLDSFDKKKSEILKRIARDERGNQGEESLLNKIKVTYNFTLNNKLVNELKIKAQGIADSLYLNNLRNDNRILFSFTNNEITVADWASSLTKQGVKKLDDIDKTIAAFVREKMLAYEDSQLETKYADFRNLIREYHDGILLFEISNREVWEKASKDIVGLEKFFKKNQNKYAWTEPRYKGFLVKSVNKSIEKAVTKRIKKLPSDSVIYYINKEFNNDSVKQVKIEKGLWRKGDNKNVDYLTFKSKEELPVDTLFTTQKLIGKMLKKLPEVYTDVRGQVTADYQNFLEEEWIKNLRSRYTIEVDNAVLQSVK